MQLLNKIVTAILLILFLQCTVFAQDSSIVKWKVDVTKISNQQYQLTFNGTLIEGWHLYAADAIEGLNGMIISFSEGVTTPQKHVIQTSFLLENDPVFDNKSKSYSLGPIKMTQLIDVGENPPSSVIAMLHYEVANKEEFLIEDQQCKIVLDSSNVKVNKNAIPAIIVDADVSNCGSSLLPSNSTKSSGIINLFFLGFLGGLIALLTPCVFPMIPLTVSFFTKKATSKRAGVSNALLYGLFIFLIYIILSLPFHFIDSVNPEFLNNISTNVYLNIFFFLIFIFFAFSFFGFYEISLPASFSNGADSKAGVGNIVGIFFMALTLALVSFSCTGPILGSLLAGSLSADGGAMQLTAGMAGFGLALALPFALFALFPHWLHSLPKSGGWLTTVKIVLGFFELALAFKFLSNADLVKHWGLLKREVFLGIWAIIGVLLALYLFAKIKFPHDTPPKKISKGRMIAGLIATVFTIYLLIGLTNTKYANLKFISGFPPPLYYSLYQQDSDCILGLNCTREYNQGLLLAKAQNKPVLLDFTGYACVNCRRMEENVWSDLEVNKLMKENFIVISLYVDDKKQLPADQQFLYKTKEGVEKEIKTVGDMWSTFETESFQNNAQPLYAIINANQQLLSQPVGYTPSAQEYLLWLQCGLDAFKKQ